MTDPLFVADLDTLKLKLRLSDVPSSADDTEAILNEAILRARISFYRRLGEQRVTQLQAIAFTDNPTTNDEILRALANTVEVMLVWCELMPRLPHAWMDASGDINRRWQEEAPFRETGTNEVEDRLLACKKQIEEDMQILAEEDTLGDEGKLLTFDGTPDFTPPCPGDSLRKPTGFKRNEG